jgi:hypothetical protein
MEARGAVDAACIVCVNAGRLAREDDIASGGFRIGDVDSMLFIGCTTMQCIRI